MGVRVANLIVTITMLLLCLSVKDKSLLLLIALPCVAFELIYMANMDIALYYAVNAMVCMFTAVIAVSVIKSTSAKTLAIFLSAQSLLCLALVPDWGFSINEWLQFKLSDFNDILVIILIALGVAGSDNTIRRQCFHS